ncbi:MAG: helix-turn-helix domain-containing protein [Clostridia bacterium]|nr:helix-turn-helix domain-containing protein [Clostridia bacterium]MDE6471542.1 helix-turn-helix domain-containing protein [Clostridia bacterium]
MKVLKFSKNLNDLLRTHNMSQQSLANMLCTSQSTISRWVKGFTQPNYEDLLLISIIFNESIDSLLGKDDLSEIQIEEIRQSLLSKK